MAFGEEGTGPRHLVLVGLMGAGKSVVGRLLARRLGRDFRDSDDVIEKTAGLTVSAIFARCGEAAFRQSERQTIAQLLAWDTPLVLATGGGAFIDPQTRALVRAQAVSIWLRADLALLLRRTVGRSHRPLLQQGDPAVILNRLMAERYPIYAEADVQIESRHPPEAVVDAILTALREKGFSL